MLIVPSASAAATSDMPLSTFIISINSNPSKSFKDKTSSLSILEGNKGITMKIMDL